MPIVDRAVTFYCNAKNVFLGSHCRRMTNNADSMTIKTPHSPSLREAKRAGAKALRLVWSNGIAYEISAEQLRRVCPCATCREERGEGNHEAPLSAPKKKSLLRVVESTLAEETMLTRIWSVGNYALGMEWGDGHNTGIYSFSQLWEMRPENCAGTGHENVI